MYIKNRKVLRAILVVTSFWLFVIGILVFLYQKNLSQNTLKIEKKEYKTVIIALKDIEYGEILTEESLREMEVDIAYLGSQKMPILNDLIGKRAAFTIQEGEYIYTKDLMDSKEADELVLFPIEVNAFSTIANMVSIGDYVDINVTNGDVGGLNASQIYNQTGELLLNSFSIVNSKKRIVDLRTADGRPTDGQSGLIPKYAIVRFSTEDIDRYLDAIETGTIFLGLYDNSTIEARKENYYLRKTSILENQVNVEIKEGE